MLEQFGYRGIWTTPHPKDISKLLGWNLEQYSGAFSFYYNFFDEN